MKELRINNNKLSVSDNKNIIYFISLPLKMLKVYPQHIVAGVQAKSTNDN